MSAVVQIRDHALAAAPTLGAGRLICIDGPSGSGKTTTAAKLTRILPAVVLHTDEFCPGWDGLPQLPRILADLLAAHADGRAGTYREWDWIRDRLADPVEVSPAPVLVVEGVGAGSLAIAGWTTTLAFFDADPAQRKVRAMERDGDYFRDQWAPWARAEDTYFAADRVRERADLTFRTG